MIDRLVVWGGREGLDSFRHIMRHFHQNAGKMGIQSIWVDDSPAFRPQPGDTVIAADVTAKHIPFVKGVDYVLHNFDGSHPICQQANPENLLRLQVWTHDASGEHWDSSRQFDREARILFQPWGTDLLPEEFMEPVFNPQSRNITFVGAIWKEMHHGTDLGNENAILELKAAAKEAGLTFNHLTQISDTEMVNVLREARLTPAVAGGWQVEHGYIPCRALKNPTFGCMSFTNVPVVRELLKTHIEGDTVTELVSNALRMKRSEYELVVRSQQIAVFPYNYRENLLAIDRALQEGKGYPSGIPFANWKHDDLNTNRLLNQRIYELRDILKEAAESLTNAICCLEDVPDLIDVLKKTYSSFARLVPMEDVYLMTVKERAKQRLLSDNSEQTRETAAVLRTIRERIMAALQQ